MGYGGNVRIESTVMALVVFWEKYEPDRGNKIKRFNFKQSKKTKSTRLRF